MLGQVKTLGCMLTSPVSIGICCKILIWSETISKICDILRTGREWLTAPSRSWLCGHFQMPLADLCYHLRTGHRYPPHPVCRTRDQWTDLPPNFKAEPFCVIIAAQGLRHVNLSSTAISIPLTDPFQVHRCKQLTTSEKQHTWPIYPAQWATD